MWGLTERNTHKAKHARAERAKRRAEAHDMERRR